MLLNIAIAIANIFFELIGYESCHGKFKVKLIDDAISEEWLVQLRQSVDNSI